MAETKKCEACGQEIGVSEEKCPKCGVEFSILDEEITVIDRALKILDARRKAATPPAADPQSQLQPQPRKSIFRSLGGK